MTWENSAITITTLLPIVGALVILAMPRDKERAIRALGIVFTGAALVLAVAITVGFDYGTDGLQYVLDVNWISAIGVRYHVGIDGIVNGAGETAGRTGNVLKHLQTGNVQWYAVGLFVGVIALAVVFIELV